MICVAIYYGLELMAFVVVSMVVMDFYRVSSCLFWRLLQEWWWRRRPDDKMKA